MNNQQQMYDLCKQHLYRYVLVQTTNNQVYDGIVENVDETNLYLAVPITDGEQRGENDEQRLFGGGAFYGGYPGYYGYPGYGNPWYGGYPYRPRRFGPIILPLAAIAALSLLPYY